MNLYAQMSDSAFVNNAMDRTNCLWRIVFSKQLKKCILLCITLLMMFISLFIVKFFNAEDQFYIVDIHFAFNGFSVFILKVYPLIVCAFILFGSFGTFALFKGAAKFIGMYASLLFFAFILNVISIGPVVTNGIYRLINLDNKFSQLIMNYDIDHEAKTTIDKIQETVRCCGFRGPEQWNDDLRLNTNLDFDDAEYFLLPDSCYMKRQYDKCTLHYHNGCGKAVRLEILSVISAVLLLSSGLSVLLLLGFITARALKRNISKAEENNFMQMSDLAKTKIASNNELEGITKH